MNEDTSRSVMARRIKPRGRPVLLATILLTACVLLLAILLPPYCAPREQGNRVKCASNLRQIGQAALMYANDHAGKLPDDLETLLTAEDLSPSVFVCPSSNDSPAQGPTTQAVVAAMKKPGTDSYVYLGKGLGDRQLSADVVLAYEPISNHAGKGMNVLFGDGRVEWMDAAPAAKLLKQISSGRRPVKLPQGP